MSSTGAIVPSGGTPNRIGSVPEPLLSVVVSTHNHPAALARLLAGLRAQTLACDHFEVIVVDDGSAGSGTQAVLSDELRRGALRSHGPPSRGAGPGGRAQQRLARGALAARGLHRRRLRPRSDVAECRAQVSREHPRAIIQGRTEPNPAELWCRECSPAPSASTIWVPSRTLNIFYPRAVLESLEGFDEAYGPRPTAEDTDLAWRAIEAGCPTVFAADAVVFHAVEELGLRGSLDVASRWTPAVRVFAMHPQLRATLNRRMFWNVWHYLLWRSLVALLAPAWLRRMILTKHLLELRKRARFEGAGAWAVPLLLVHDLVECWAVARGAVRYRTLVL